MSTTHQQGGHTSPHAARHRTAKQHTTARQHRAAKHGHQHDAHRFDDAKKWAQRFEDPKRDAWQRPKVVLKAMALSKADVVADIGSATGYFPVRIAPRVKKIYGVDIAPSMVNYLTQRAAEEGLANLVSIQGTEASANLPESVDIALIVNTYHHIQNRVSYFRQLALRAGGRLVVVDFKPDDNPPFGPPPGMRLAAATVRAELEQAGFSFVSTDAESLPYQYIVILQK